MDYDLIVVGSGAGALLAAIAAHDGGLRPLVIEKTNLVGGTSALSGGGIWIPVNDDMAKAGIQDSTDTAFGYVKRCARGLASDRRILAYVETARTLARTLAQIGVPYRCMPRYSDYYPATEGALPGGRTMDPVDFNAGRLGLAGLELLRPTNPGQLILGRMQINAFEARSMLARERKSKWVLMWIMARYFLDYPWRSKTRRDRRLTGGQAFLSFRHHGRQFEPPLPWRYRGGQIERRLVCRGRRNRHRSRAHHRGLRSRNASWSRCRSGGGIEGPGRQQCTGPLTRSRCPSCSLSSCSACLQVADREGLHVASPMMTNRRPSRSSSVRSCLPKPAPRNWSRRSAC